MPQFHKQWRFLGRSLGRPWPSDFWLSPCFASPILCLISRSNSFDWHIQQITFSQQNFKPFEDFLVTVLTIFTSLCWVWQQISLHYKGKSPWSETFMLAPYFFPWSPSFFILQPQQSIYSKIQSQGAHGNNVRVSRLTWTNRQVKYAI